MKKRLLASAFVSAALLFSAGRAMAETPDESDTVEASATISAITGLSIDARAIDDDETQVEIKFGSVDEIYQLAEDYIAVSATSNYGSWKIDIYTDNFEVAPDTTTWGMDQFGGLVDTDFKNRLPLAWAASTFTITSGELESELPAGPVDDGFRWTFLKDKADADWDSDQETGYAVVAYGGAGEYANLNCPEEGVRVLYEKEVVEGSMPFYIYLQTVDFAPPGSYEGTIGFDLYHE